MRLLLIALLLSCQVQSSPTLADEFVHGEVQTRKRIIEQAFALWQVRGQVDITNKDEIKQHRIVFTDTCQEDFIAGYRPSCIRTIADQWVLASCTFLVDKSIIIIRRSYYQNVTDDIRLGIIAHEIGHCLGLPHSDVVGEIMHPSGSYAPTEAEILKAHSLWPRGQLFQYDLYDQY